MNSPLGNIQRSTTADKVFETLHQRIISGHFQSGDVLPSQDELARQLKVSRNTLREAIFRLSALGLVHSKQGVGTVVQPTTPSNYIRSLPDHLLLNKTTVTEFIEARLFTERSIVQLVVERAAEKDLERLQTILDQQHAAIKAGDDEEFNRLDLGFHMELGRVCGNSVMLKFFESIWELLSQFASKSCKVPGNVQKAYVSHCRIFEAVKERDTQKAVQEMEAHIQKIARRTMNYLGADAKRQNIAGLAGMSQK